MSDPSSPTPPLRRQLVAQLLDLRKQAGLSQQQAAEAIGVDRSTINRLETFQGAAPTLANVTALATQYGADAETVRQLVDLARQVRERGWYHGIPAAILGDVLPLAELESHMVALFGYGNPFVTGHGQTEEYARALLTHGITWLDKETVEQRVAVRMARQEHALNSAAELTVIIDEAALDRPIGGPAVMADQCQHLLRLMERPNVDLRILPRTAIPQWSFLVITLRDGGQYVITETNGGSAYSDAPRDLAIYARAEESLREHALEDDGSASLISRYLTQYRREQHV